MNFYYDIQFNVLGTVYATLGVVVTSVYQVVGSFICTYSLQIIYANVEYRFQEAFHENDCS